MRKEIFYIVFMALVVGGFFHLQETQETLRKELLVEQRNIRSHLDHLSQRVLFLYVMRSREMEIEEGLDGLRDRRKEIKSIATAYLCVDPKEGRTHGITKSGRRCVPGRSAAVDPKVIPFGSLIYHPGLDRWFVAEDTGNLVKGTHVDFAVATRKKALQIGRKEVTLVILPPSST